MRALLWSSARKLALEGVPVGHEIKQAVWRKLTLVCENACSAHRLSNRRSQDDRSATRLSQRFPPFAALLPLFFTTVAIVSGELLVTMRQRAVITGGAGFLGSTWQNGSSTRTSTSSASTTSSPGRQRTYGIEGPGRIHLAEGDITEHIAFQGTVDFVLHFASPASPVDYAEFPIETLKAGIVGTLHTLGLAKEKGARYLLASTSETYGDPLVHPQPESYWGNVNPVGPRACYDEAKRFAEALTTSYRTQHGVNTAIMRIFNTYGPRMRPNDGRADPDVHPPGADGEPMTVAGDGSQTRSVCYVDDLVDGVLRLLFSDLSGPVNIGNPHELTMLELAELGPRAGRVRLADRGSSTPAGRPVGAPTRHHPGPDRVGLGAEGRRERRPGADHRVVPRRPETREASRGCRRRRPGRPRQATRRGSRSRSVGTGYVGAVTASCLAWLGHEVCGLDTDDRAGQLNDGQVPFFEPGLSELLTATLATGRLRFTARRRRLWRRRTSSSCASAHPRRRRASPDLTSAGERRSHVWPRTCGPTR